MKSAGYDETVSFFLLFLGIPNPGRAVQKTLFSFLSRLENTISLKNQVPLWTKRSASSGMPFPLPERAAEKPVPKERPVFPGSSGEAETVAFALVTVCGGGGPWDHSKGLLCSVTIT